METFNLSKQADTIPEFQRLDNIPGKHDNSTKDFFSDYFGSEMKMKEVLYEKDICKKLGIPQDFLERLKDFPLKKDKHKKGYVYQAELVKWFYDNFLTQESDKQN